MIKNVAYRKQNNELNPKLGPVQKSYWAFGVTSNQYPLNNIMSHLRLILALESSPFGILLLCLSHLTMYRLI